MNNVDPSELTRFALIRRYIALEKSIADLTARFASSTDAELREYVKSMSQNDPEKRTDSFWSNFKRNN